MLTSRALAAATEAMAEFSRFLISSLSERAEAGGVAGVVVTGLAMTAGRLGMLVLAGLAEAAGTTGAVP